MKKKNNVNNNNSRNVYGIIGGMIVTAVGISIAKKIINRRPSVDDLDQNESDDKVDSSDVNVVDDRTEAYKITAEIKTIISRIDEINPDTIKNETVTVGMPAVKRELLNLIDIINNRLTNQIQPVITDSINERFNRMKMLSDTIFYLIDYDIKADDVIKLRNSVFQKINTDHPDDMYNRFREEFDKIDKQNCKIIILSKDELDELKIAFMNLSDAIDSYNAEKAQE